MAEPTKVLLTGAAGQVGSILRAHWAGQYSLVLADLPQPTAPTGSRCALLPSWQVAACLRATVRTLAVLGVLAYALLSARTT